MIELTDEMRTAVNNALDDGHPVISTSVGADGQPSLAFFGSTQVYSDDQLAVWVRNREGGFLQRIAANPHVAFLYRNPRLLADVAVPRPRPRRQRPGGARHDLRQLGQARTRP